MVLLIFGEIMKLKVVPMLIGVLAVTTITTTPLAAFAQAPAPAPQRQQNQQATPRITLSAEQQAEFEKLQASIVSQIEAKLNPEQKKQYAEARASGGGLIQSLGAIKNVSESAAFYFILACHFVVRIGIFLCFGYDIVVRFNLVGQFVEARIQFIAVERILAGKRIQIQQVFTGMGEIDGDGVGNDIEGVFQFPALGKQHG